MAEVFLGSMVGAEGFSRKVAIKRVLPGYSDNDAFAQMFVSEARISSQLVHPNIVSVFDFDRDADGRLFLVMELVEGRDLDSLIASGTVPLPVVIFVIGEVLRGLGYAHDLPAGTDVRGVVHRDVSPHNVLLSWEGSVKVSDFGIAKARAASEATASVFIKGKPAYMSPEQANGQPLDGRSDLFAVGIMLWEMLVGRRLFVGEDTRATLAAVLFGQIPRPRSLRGDIPKDVERVTMKLLEREVSARYATAEDALADLLECNDAPKRGREALSELLADRFPMEARVRGSRARSFPPQDPSLPVAPTITPAGLPAASAVGSGLGGGEARERAGKRRRTREPVAAPAASLGAMRNAPTGTLPPIAPRGGRAWKLALLATVIVASGVATFAIASLAKSGPTPDASPGSGSTIAAVPPKEAPKPPPPPPPPVNVDAGAVAPPVDAAPPDAPKKDAQSAQHGHAAKYGQLKVSAFPVVEVIVDGTNYGETPKTIKLTVGRHSVRLRNKDQGIDEPHAVQITESVVTPLDRIK
jgi:eukaryotic-like serine/threonine-protein kinase